MKASRVLLAFGIASSFVIAGATLAATDVSSTKTNLSATALQEQNLPTSTIPTSQTPPSPPHASTTPQTKDLINLASNSCFDFYHFGSVQVSVQSFTSKIAAGSDLDLTGKVTNANTYPIVDGSIYVKIYKVGDYFSTTEGGYLVDQFVASSSVTIAANASLPVEFQWHIPTSVTPGAYRVATYFVEGDSNLSGLTFTDDIQGSSYDFQIASGQKNVIEFNKNKATIDGKPYQFVGAAPTTDKNALVHLVAPIDNATGNGNIVGVTWKVYSWDGLSDARLVASTDSTLFVPNGGASTSIDIIDTQHPVYYAVATITYQDSKSIEAFRFVRNNVDQLRLENPAVITFPLQANIPSAIFTCLHGMGTSALVSGGRLELSLTDRSGGIIASSTYNGLVTGAMMLRKNLFTPHQNYDYAVLTAKLYLNNVLEDQYSIIYDCKAIDPSRCLPASTNAHAIIAGIIIILLIAAIGFSLYRRSKKQSPRKK